MAKNGWIAAGRDTEEELQERDRAVKALGKPAFEKAFRAAVTTVRHSLCKEILSRLNAYVRITVPFPGIGSQAYAWVRERKGKGVKQRR